MTNTAPAFAPRFWGLVLLACLSGCDSSGDERTLLPGDVSMDLTVADLADAPTETADASPIEVLADSAVLDQFVGELPPIVAPSDCWKTSCGQLWSACSAVADCVELSSCVTATDLALCKAKAGPLATGLWTDLVACAEGNCRDPFSSSCADRCGMAKPPEATCACDVQCEQYGDCCWDYKAECEDGGTPVGNGSCKGQCGVFFGDDSCNCDDACVDYNDCCKDYETECKSTPASDTVSAPDATDSPDSAEDVSAVDAADPATPDTN